MRKTARLLISISVLVMMIGAIFLAGKPQHSSAQDAPFKSYQLRVFCDKSEVATAVFWYDVKESSMGLAPIICVGDCPGGKVSIADALAGLPAEVSAALQAMVDKHQADAAAGNGSCLTCLEEGKKPPEKKCEKPTPWPAPPWNPSDCKDLQDVVFRHNGKRGVFTACDQVLGQFQSSDVRFIEFAQAMWPDTICCDKLKGGGTFPCDYFSDVDCDGNHNIRDDFPDNYVEAFLYTIPPGAPPDPLPQGLRRQQILPGSACDGGKWELMKGNNRCKSKGKSTSLFWYEATWKCPKTGVQVSKASSPRLLRKNAGDCR